MDRLISMGSQSASLPPVADDDAQTDQDSTGNNSPTPTHRTGSMSTGLSHDNDLENVPTIPGQASDHNVHSSDPHVPRDMGPPSNHSFPSKLESPSDQSMLSKHGLQSNHSDHIVPAESPSDQSMPTPCTQPEPRSDDGVPTKLGPPRDDEVTTAPVSTADSTSKSQTSATQYRYIIVDHDSATVNSERDVTLLNTVSTCDDSASKVTLPFCPVYCGDEDNMCMCPSNWCDPGSDSEANNDDLLTVSPYAYAQSPGDSCMEPLDNMPAPAFVDYKDTPCSSPHSVSDSQNFTQVEVGNCDTIDSGSVSQDQFDVNNNRDTTDTCSSVELTSNGLNDNVVDEHFECRTCETHDEFSRDKDMAYLLSENDNFFQEIDKVLMNKYETDGNGNAAEVVDECHDTKQWCEEITSDNTCTNVLAGYSSQSFSEQQDTLETPCLGKVSTDIVNERHDSVLNTSSGESYRVSNLTPLESISVPTNGTELECTEVMPNAALDKDMDDVRGISPEIICMTHLSPSEIYGKETTLGMPRLISRQSTDSSLNTPDPIPYADSDPESATHMNPLKESQSCFVPIEPDSRITNSLDCINNNVSNKRKLDEYNVVDSNGNITTSVQQDMYHSVSTTSYDFANQIHQYNSKPPDISTWTAVNSHSGPGKYGSHLQHSYLPGYPNMMGDHNSYNTCTQEFGYPGGLDQADIAGQFSNKPTCTVSPYTSTHYNPSVASHCNTYIGSQYRNAQINHPFLNPPQGSVYTNPGMPYTESLRHSCQFAGFQNRLGQRMGQGSMPGSAICRLDFSSPAISPENCQQNVSFPLPDFISKPYTCMPNLSRPDPVFHTHERRNVCSYLDDMSRYMYGNMDVNNNVYLPSPASDKVVVDGPCATAVVTYPQTMSAFTASCPTSAGLYSPSVDTDVIDSSDNEMTGNISSHGDEPVVNEDRVGWGTKQLLVPLTARNTQVFCPVAELGSRKVADLIQSAEKKEPEDKIFPRTLSPPIAHTKLNQSFTKDFLQQRKTKSPSSAFCAVLDLSKKAERKRQKSSRGGSVPVIAQPPVAMPVQSLLQQAIPNVNVQGQLLLPYLASLYPAMSASSISTADLHTSALPTTHTTRSNYVPILPNNTRPDKLCNSDTLVIRPPVTLPVNIYNGTPYTAYISRLPGSVYSSVNQSGPIVATSSQASTGMATLKPPVQYTKFPANTQACRNAQAILNIQLANKQLNPPPLSVPCQPVSQAPWQTLTSAAASLTTIPNPVPRPGSDVMNPYLPSSSRQHTVTPTKSRPASSEPVPPVACAGAKSAAVRARQSSGRAAATDASSSASADSRACASGSSACAAGAPVMERPAAGTAVRGAQRPGGAAAEHDHSKVATYYPVPGTKQLKKASEGGRKTFKARHCYFTCLQIGTFKYATKQIHYERTARVKFLYSKRKLVYEFQLNDGRGVAVSAQRQLAEVEVPFESIVALWLHGKEMRLQVTATPRMHRGARHWERSVRYGPHAPAIYNRGSEVDLTDGQLTDVPYHYVQFKTNCGDKIREELGLFDARFAHLLKLPLVVDPGQTLRPPDTEVNRTLDTPEHITTNLTVPVYMETETVAGKVVSCQCSSGCSCQQCACCVRGVTCTEGECGCVDCRNPLNILHQLGLPAAHARTDPCLMENIYQVRKLDCYVKIALRLECCGVAVPLLQCIPGTVPCPAAGCHAHYTYSWCLASLCNNEASPRNHCVKCGRCTDFRNIHCQTCNICYFAGESGAFKCPVCHNRLEGESVEMDSSTDSDV